MWVGLGIMKTVATPIYFSTDTKIPMPIKKKRKANLEEDLIAGGTDVGRTGHHEDCGYSNLF